MKQLKDIISEKLIINKHSKVKNNKLKDPIIGKTAWDYNGEPWEIIDFCDINNKQELNKLIRKYDNTGTFNEFLNEYDPNDYETITYAVAVESIYAGEYTCIFIWGYYGVCFENKPKNKK